MVISLQYVGLIVQTCRPAGMCVFLFFFYLFKFFDGQKINTYRPRP